RETMRKFDQWLKPALCLSLLSPVDRLRKTFAVSSATRVHKLRPGSHIRSVSTTQNTAAAAKNLDS
ncbi:hypothetical protein BaRGS_00034300, partial [Batillaria attramentaria]